MQGKSRTPEEQEEFAKRIEGFEKELIKLQDKYKIMLVPVFNMGKLPMSLEPMVQYVDKKDVDMQNKMNQNPGIIN